MKYKTPTRYMLMMLSIIFFSSCEQDEPQKNLSGVEKKSSSTHSQFANARIGPKEKITISTTDDTQKVQNVFAGRTPLTISSVFSLGAAMQNGTSSSATKLVPLSKFKFNSDEQKGTRRPQGTANFGKYVINGWYFTGNSEYWEGNCKLTVADIATERYFNLVPVQFHGTQTTKFQRIESHASGLTVIGHYLYLTDSAAILVFDLNKIYKIMKPTDPVVAVGQKFIYEYTYMVPQVGEIKFATDTGAKASYMSLTKIGAQDHFVIGNFYSTVSGSYDNGGKSMIWLLPVDESTYSFPTMQTNATREYNQIDPLFPSGPDKNTTMTRIQGALVIDNVVILNRSYSSETYQLIVMKYADALADTPTITSFFSGTTSSAHSYNNKNWLEGCEDLEYYNGRIWTVTEFDGRAIYSADLDDITGLMQPVP